MLNRSADDLAQTVKRSNNDFLQANCHKDRVTFFYNIFDKKFTIENNSKAEAVLLTLSPRLSKPLHTSEFLLDWLSKIQFCMIDSKQSNRIAIANASCEKLVGVLKNLAIELSVNSPDKDENEFWDFVTESLKIILLKNFNSQIVKRYFQSLIFHKILESKNKDLSTQFRNEINRLTESLNLDPSLQASIKKSTHQAAWGVEQTLNEVTEYKVPYSAAVFFFLIATAMRCANLNRGSYALLSLITILIAYYELQGMTFTAVTNDYFTNKNTLADKNNLFANKPLLIQCGIQHTIKQIIAARHFSNLPNERELFALQYENFPTMRELYKLQKKTIAKSTKTLLPFKAHSHDHYLKNISKGNTELFQALSKQMHPASLLRVDADAYYKISLNNLPKDIRVIISLDIDDTIYDYEASAIANSPVYIQLKEISEIIANYDPDQILLVATTSRDLAKEYQGFANNMINSSFRMFNEIKLQFNLNIALAFYTDANSKLPVLNYLYQQFLLPKGINKFNVKHLDDWDDCIDNCKENGFDGILVEKDPNLHVRQLEKSLLEWSHSENYSETNLPALRRS